MFLLQVQDDMRVRVLGPGCWCCCRVPLQDVTARCVWPSSLWSLGAGGIAGCSCRAPLPAFEGFGACVLTTFACRNTKIHKVPKQNRLGVALKDLLLSGAIAGIIFF